MFSILEASLSVMESSILKRSLTLDHFEILNALLNRKSGLSDRNPVPISSSAVDERTPGFKRKGGKSGVNQFHQYFTQSIYVQRSQKGRNYVKLSVSFCTFGIRGQSYKYPEALLKA
jgi:hypothetical protein